MKAVTDASAKYLVASATQARMVSGGTVGLNSASNRHSTSSSALAVPPVTGAGAHETLMTR